MALIVCKEEELILEDRAADGTAKLVVPQFRFELDALCVESGITVIDIVVDPRRPSGGGDVGVECIVPEEFEQVSVKMVRT